MNRTLARLVVAATIMISVCALAGCATPPPIIEYRTATISLPPALMTQEAAPAVPECTTDACFMGYVDDVYAWGKKGWLQAAALQQAVIDPPAPAK